MRVLRRHLVSREERLGETSASRRGSTTAELANGRPNLANVHFPSEDEHGGSAAEEDDDFPISYTAPGADITFVILSLSPLSLKMH